MCDRCTFLLVVFILTRPTGLPKYCKTRTNIQRLGYKERAGERNKGSEGTNERANE